MDFITSLPKSQGYEVILVVADRLSKYAHILSLRHPFTARNMTKKFIQDVAKLHGFPKLIISDRDPIFLSKFWGGLFRLQGTTLRISTFYHPQTDGQTKVVNRCLETFLFCIKSEQPTKWHLWLSWEELWYNTSSHSAIGKTHVDFVATVLIDRDEALRP